MTTFHFFVTIEMQESWEEEPTDRAVCDAVSDLSSQYDIAYVSVLVANNAV